MTLHYPSICFLIAILEVTICAGTSKVDCSFDNNNGSYSKCGYRVGWDGMLRANWQFVRGSRDGKISKDGYFAYVESRRRPKDFSAQLYSQDDHFVDDDCVTFSYINKGPRKPYPYGRLKLEVYFIPGGRDIEKSDRPIWTSTKRTGGNRWKKEKVPLKNKSNGLSLVGALVFAAVRGGSKRAYIAIDNIVVGKCKNSHRERFRALPARRPIQTRNFSSFVGDRLPTASPLTVSLPVVTLPARRRTGGRRRNRKRKRKNRNRKPKKGVFVYLPGDQVLTESNEPFVPTLVGQERPQEECDFLHYTQELRRCLRAFFSMLKRHKSKRKCNSDYFLLETCLKKAATKCVPAAQMPRETVHGIVTDTLQNKFKTQKVYCLEEGAFVYPEFSLGSIPLQCSRIYFGRLTSCGGAFAGIFNFKHGDPSLCREYFQANECQRRTTAEECEFDTRSKLIYGLNLQYQFAHNPFCIDLPFSAWWPDQ